MSAPSWNLQRRMCNTENIIASRKDHLLPLYRKYPGDYLDLYTYNNLMIIKPWLGPATNANISFLQLSVVGGDKILIICVDFSDKPASVPPSVIYNRFFGTDGNTFKNYYSEVSNNLFNPDGIIVGWYRAPQTYAYYRDGCNYGLGAYPHNIQKLFEDVLDIIDNDPNVTEDTLSSLDIDGDGKLNRVFVIHAGGEASHTANCDDIWSYTTTISPKTVKNKIFNYFSITAEYTDLPSDSQRSGNDCHEFGHIIGLPDLYNTTNFTSIVGVWSLMDQGGWGVDDTGINPTHLDPWSKNILGWITIDNNQIGNVSVGNIENYHKAYKYTSSSNLVEYFIIENRQNEGFDSSLPGNGLLIWHINEIKDQSSDINCRKVYLIQADNRKDIENKINSGDGDDPYPGGTNNRLLNDSSNPNSLLCDGIDSFLEISNISDSQTVMSMVINRTNIGSANFISYPSGARIWIDDVDQELYTSNTVTGLIAGNHTYKLTLTGYIDATGNFTIIAGETKEITVTLMVSTGNASFTSIPSGADIWIDDIDRGVVTPTTIPGLATGSHSYKLTLAGYQDDIGIFSINHGLTTIIPTVQLVQEIQFNPRLFGLALDLGIILGLKWLYNLYKEEKKLKS